MLWELKWQEHIFRVLQLMADSVPDDLRYLVEQAFRHQGRSFEPDDACRFWLKRCGWELPDMPEVWEVLAEILRTQVDDRGEKILIRGLPGKEIALNENDRATLDQGYVLPVGLRVGDVLATGQRVFSYPRGAGDGNHILVHLSDGADGLWTMASAVMPVALMTEERAAVS